MLRESGGALSSRGYELETAVILSLFLDAEAKPEDNVPASELRRGWWGDAFAEVPGDKIGSRIWTLERAKATTETLRKLEAIAADALKWLVEDRVAAKVVPTAAYEPDGFGTKRALLGVDVYRPSEATPESFGPWEALRGL